MNLILFAAPLLMFIIKLKQCKVKGIKDYMLMTTHYVDAFDQKWVKDKSDNGEEQLGTSDIQSLADLTNSVNVIKKMRIVPISRNLILVIAAGVILPFVPFVFLKFNFMELMRLVFQLITGK